MLDTANQLTPIKLMLISAEAQTKDISSTENSQPDNSLQLLQLEIQNTFQTCLPKRF